MKESEIESMFQNMSLDNSTTNALALSRDHKAGEIVSETERVERAGAIIENGELRLKGSTNAYVGFTRAYGDFTYKTKECPALIAEPEITVTKRSPDSDLFLVLACDGVWDVMTNQECSNFVHQALKSTSDLSELCSKLLFRCLEKGSTDNMSCIIILFEGGDSSIGRASLESPSDTTSSGNRGIRKALF